MSRHTAHIDPQLLADSHPLFIHGSCHIRLHRNASLPWVILIPQTNHIEFCDLDEQQQLEITRLSRVIGGFFKTECGAEKINFAAIGNVVQQLHIHVIGRNQQDPLWPDVVWGHVLPDEAWTDGQLKRMKQRLIALLAEESST
ncbi:HIT family protein [Marinicella sediminis]|uniref:HIT family protein n=1 Tax=Marinicella sediminis TaxID=1792834 RepID=A0ABV7JE60_9GAMM|nr:HIT domain-containing protein [Marinicella sediminis]